MLLVLLFKIHLPHEIEVRLDMHKTDVAILTPETVDLIWYLSSSLSLPAGFSIQDEAMDVARPAPQGSHFHADVIDLLP